MTINPNGQIHKCIHADTYKAGVPLCFKNLGRACQACERKWKESETTQIQTIFKGDER